VFLRRCHFIILYSVDGSWIDYECGALVECYWEAKTVRQRSTCPVAGLSTINFTYSGLGSNPVFCHENPFNSCRVLFSANTSKLIGAFLNLKMRKCQKNERKVSYRIGPDTEKYIIWLKNGLEVVTNCRGLFELFCLQNVYNVILQIRFTFICFIVACSLLVAESFVCCR